MLSLVPVSRVLKPGCSHLKHCRQELLPCSTTYCLCVLDSSSLGRRAPLWSSPWMSDFYLRGAG